MKRQIFIKHHGFNIFMGESDPALSIADPQPEPKKKEATKKKEA